MSIALFKPLEAAAGEGEAVWSKIAQKVIHSDDVDAHVADGWLTSALEALEMAELMLLQKANQVLSNEVAEIQGKIDGRSKAARELKAKQGDAQ